jgi:hypothetical protein
MTNPINTPGRLKPAVSAVKDALDRHLLDCFQSSRPATTESIAAVALRVTSQQVMPSTVDPRISTARFDIMAIADALEHPLSSPAELP